MSNANDEAAEQLMARCRATLIFVDVKIGGMFAVMRHGVTPSEKMIEDACNAMG